MMDAPQDGRRQACLRGQRFLADLANAGEDLPYSPVILNKIFNLTGENSSAPLEIIAEAVGSDQGLTARVLTVANSAFYGLQSQVSSISRAVAVLGLSEIKSLVLALGVSAMTKGKPLPQGFSLTGLWAHQMRVALGAKALAQRLGLDPDNVFTSALLHDLGKLITAACMPGDFTAIRQITALDNVSFAEAEDRHWGLEHGLTGAMTLRSWNLPEELTEPVNWHHAPLYAPQFKKQAVVVGLADALVLRLFEPDAPAPCDWQAQLAKLRLDEGEMLGIVDDACRSRDVDGFAAGLA